MSGISSALCCATNAAAKFIEFELFNFIQHFMGTYLKITEVAITHFIIQFAHMGTLPNEEDVNLQVCLIESSHLYKLMSLSLCMQYCFLIEIA